jgi:hypothetical protein
MPRENDKAPTIRPRESLKTIVAGWSTSGMAIEHGPLKSLQDILVS